MRIVLYVLLGLLALLLLTILVIVISSLFVDRNRFYPNESPYYRFLLDISTAAAVFLIRIRVHVTGLDNIPESRFLLVSNHRSKFDPILTWYVLRKQHVSFISKKENFSVPVFGRLIRKCCFMDIDRENIRRALETYRQASDLLRRDEVSVGVYPEGTRNNGTGLLPFHDSVFRIAKDADFPIVVMTVKKTADIKKNYPWRRSHVYLDFLEVMPPEEISDMHSTEIGKRVREVMLTSLGEE